MPVSCNSEVKLRTLEVAVSATATRSKRVLKAQYGDGYKASRPDGLNPWSTTWQLDTVPLQPEDAAALADELEAVGESPFWWHPPGAASESAWSLEPVQWKTAFNGGLVTLSFSVETWNGPPPS